MRNKRTILPLVATLLLLPSQINSCGMLVHMDVADRALDSFVYNGTNDYERIIRSYHSYFQAGAPYPDWGYLCGTPAGEASHWPPFIDAIQSYMNETYEPGSEEWNRLLAFTFGVESHIQSDVQWHWGKTGKTSPNQGFLNSMAHDGSYCRDDEWGTVDPSCHNIGDIGADWYIGGRGNADYFNETWTVPTEDLSKIYATKMNLTDESPTKIFECTTVMFVGAILERHLASLISFYYDSRATFLTEDLDLWYYGGLEDMGAAVSWKFQTLAQMFDKIEPSGGKNGQEKQETCSLFGMNFLKDKIGYYSKAIGLTYSVNKHGDYTFSHNLSRMNANFDEVAKEILKDMGLTTQFPTTSPKQKKGTFGLSSTTFESLKQRTFLGKSLAMGDFNGDGQQELFMGAPGYSTKGNPDLGAVYYSPLNSSNTTKAFDSNIPHLLGQGFYSRFGYSMVAMDINRDGIDDLIVGAPAQGNWSVSQLTDYDNKEFNGAVHVYLGQKDIGIVQGAQPDFSVKQGRSNLTIDNLMNMGQNVRASDCDGDGFDDLIVLSPLAQVNGTQRGIVSVFYNLNKLDTNDKALYLDDADFQVNGTHDWQWFGYDAVCTKDKVLLIGAPGARGSGQWVEASGAVYAYNITDGSLLYTLLSNEDQSKFGKSLSYNPDYNLLAVGAPSRTSGIMYHAGAVYLYDLSKSNLTWDNYQSVIRSNDRGSRFGTSIQWDNDTLIASAPALTSWSVIGVPNDQGIIYSFNEATKFVGILSSDIYSDMFDTPEAGCRHGEKLLYSKNTQQLIVGSPYCENSLNTTQERLAGRIYIFNTQPVAIEQPALSKEKAFLSE